MRAFIAVICLSTLSFAAAAQKIKSNVCEVLLNSIVLSSPGKGEIQVSQAQRIHALISRMNPEQQQALFAAVQEEDLMELTKKIRNGTLSDEQQTKLAKFPGMELVIQDLAELGDNFPGIFALQNAGQVVLKVLEVVRRQEMQSKISNEDLLKSQSMAPRLRRTIDNTMINLIEQGTQEYGPTRFGKSGFELFWYKLGRFWSPTYKKVKDIIDFAQNHERQLTRLRLVDKLIINLALGDAVTLQLSDDEIQKLAFQVLNSPDEIKDIQDSLRAVLGKSFEVGVGLEIGKFDINKSAHFANKRDQRFTNEKFDQANLLALEVLNDQLNASRLRRGLSKRQAKDFDIVELQLYAEAYTRRVDLYREFYDGITAESSKEKYQVEESYTVSVYDGHDDKGNVRYRTETHYRWVTEIPSFEDILSREFNTGDRSVSGLEEVEARTANVAKREGVTRKAISSAESLVDDVLENYQDAVMKGVKRDQLLESLTKSIQITAELEEAQKSYVAWSDDQIRKQYSKDVVENFKRRNQQMLDRIVNIKRLMQQLHELMTRNQLQLHPSFDLFDYTNWLSTLKHHRNVNYAVKTATGVAAVGAAGAYMSLPEFQYSVDQWASYFSYTVQSLIHSR